VRLPSRVEIFLEAKIDLICASDRGLSPGKLSVAFEAAVAAAVVLFSLRWLRTWGNCWKVIAKALGRCSCRDVGCKELKGRLVGLLDRLHGVMRRLRQVGRNETGGNTLGLRSPEHGIRHATQSALLMTWDWRGGNLVGRGKHECWRGTEEAPSTFGRPMPMVRSESSSDGRFVPWRIRM
jgi:hypothetical protein